ncbi:MAG: nitrate ABC transporter permease [Ruminococcaceae bacterium]|nr:nitrate ABC transporter permease [Oscillospiraceae bacterium]
MTNSSTTKQNIVSICLWLLIWQAVAMIINEEILFVSPLSVLFKFPELIKSFIFWQSISFSILRILAGFFISTILSSIFAYIAYKSAAIEAFFRPIITVIKSTPVASFIILALIFIGKDIVPMFICMLMVTPIVYSNVLNGLKNVDKDLKEMSKLYDTKQIKHLYFPSLLPYITAAIDSGLGLCWKAGIAAEVICRTIPSIGNQIWETKFYIETTEMFAYTTVVILLSVLFDFLIKKATRAVLKKYNVEVVK